MRFLLLPPPDDGTVVLVREQLPLPGQAGQCSGRAQPDRLRQLQQGHVVVDGVPVVVGVQDGPVHDVLDLAALVHHQVVLPNAHNQVLAHAVRGSEDPPRVDQRAAAERLAVLVEDNDLPRPTARVRLPPPNDPQRPGNVRRLGRKADGVPDPALGGVGLEAAVRRPLGPQRLDRLRTERESLLVRDVEGLAALVPGLALAPLAVAVSLLGDLLTKKQNYTYFKSL